MKKILNILFVSLLLTFALNTNAQDRRTVDTKIADALAKMQTKDLQELDTQLDYILETKQEGLGILLDMLQPASEVSTDTEARMALGSLARYVSQDDQSGNREWVAESYANYNSNSEEVQAFLLQMLKQIGTDAQVDEIASKLNNRYLCADASIALAAINTPKSEDALIECLKKETVADPIDAINALGEMGSSKAVDVLIPLLYRYEDNKIVDLSINTALAQSGNVEALNVLKRQAVNAKYLPDPSNATQSYVQLANSFAIKGDSISANAIIKNILKKCKKPESQGFKLAALEIKLRNYGKEALPSLLDEYNSDDINYRFAVLSIAEGLSDDSSINQWLEVAKGKDINSQNIVELLYFFSQVKNKQASDFLKSQLRSENNEVRLSAIKAYALIEGRNANRELVSLLVSDISQETNEAIEDALNMTCSADDLVDFSSEYSNFSPSNKIIALNLCSAKHASQSFELVQSEINNSNKDIAEAALKALPNVSTSSYNSELLQMLSSCTDDELTYVQSALVNASMQSTESKNSEFISYAKRSDVNAERMLPVLAQLGGDDALKFANDIYQNGSTKMSDVAFNSLVGWNGKEAAYTLLDIFKKKQGSDRQKAFDGFINIANGNDVTPEQKLLFVQDIYPFIKSASNKKTAVKVITNVPTYPNVMYLGTLINDRDIASEVAYAVMRSALPGGNSTGVYGMGVKEILKQAKLKISGTDSDYYKVNIQEYIDNMKDGGYESIFNGKDLSGWKGLLENPIARGKMTPEELAKRQEEVNEKMLNFWSVQDNCIVFENGAWDNLCTEKMYGDFEMWVDWYISRNGDSGIYLRGSPQVQIWDPARVDVGAQVGSGGLYNNKKYEDEPMVKADNPVEQWNTFYIKMIGDKVTVKLNGVLVVDNVVLENYWDRKIPIFKKESIELQAHETFTKFRNIYVNDLSNTEYKVSEAEEAEGFKPLFNGVDLTGWQGNTVAHKVESGGRLVYYPDLGNGNLYTDKEYDNYVVRFDFKLGAGANNGLGIRMPAEGDAAYVGATELQILDNSAPIYANLEKYQYHGSAYGIIPAMRGYLKPVGEWNSQEVYINGDDIKVVLNGTTILDGNLKEASKNGTLDKKDHPGLNRKTGYLGFLSHGSYIELKNIRIKEL